MAQFIELNIDQGTDYSLDLYLENSDGTPLNVSGYVFSSSIKKSHQQQNSTANFITTMVDSANGYVRLDMSDETTANISAGRYVFDVKQVAPGDVVTRLFEGIVTVSPEVTK